MDFPRINENASLTFTAQGASNNRGKLEKR